MLLDNKVVLVTGGGRGIGAAVCRILAGHGAKVAVNFAASREKAEAVVAQITEAGGVALPFEADVLNADAVGAMVSAIVESFGGLDGLVNNAIRGRQAGTLAESTTEDYINSFDYGCRAVLNTIRAARPIMAAQGGGRIVNIASELWNSAPSGWSVYMAGKGAMVGVSRSLARELGPENITVNVVAPGWMADEKVELGGSGSNSYAQGVPLRRQGRADEIGNVCAFYLSDLAGFVTGTYLPVCGGNVTQAGV